MPEVGLVRFAKVALEISSSAVPLYSSKFSKRTYTQPQMLAMLLLMRFEDWTFRETEVRIAEHSDLRAVLGLQGVPDHTVLYRFMKRLEEGVLDRALSESARRMPRPPSGGAVIAIDGTGLGTCALSMYFVQRIGRKRRSYLKLVVAVDVDRFMITSALAHRGPAVDSALLPGLVAGSLEAGPITQVLADAEFDAHQNHTYVREEIGAMSVIPAKRSKRSGRAHGVRGEMREHFPIELYGRRSLVETVFSILKRKLSARAPGRTLATQRTQALILALAFNIYRLRLWRNVRPRDQIVSPQLNP